MNFPEIAINNILYTTDLSESGRYAFAYALSLARLYKADLTVLHVVKSKPELNHSLVGHIPEELWENLKKESLEDARKTLLGRKRDNTYIKKCVGKFCEEIQMESPKDTQVGYNIAIELGHPVEKIIEFAGNEGCDMIVMASHGHSTLEDTMLGNTVRRVLRRASVPVMVIKLPKN